MIQFSYCKIFYGTRRFGSTLGHAEYVVTPRYRWRILAMVQKKKKERGYEL